MTVLYLHDNRVHDAGQTFGRHRTLGGVQHLIIGAGTSIPSAVTQLINLVPIGDSVSLLVLNAHGNAGWMEMGTGLSDGQARHFSALGPYMDSGGRGCEIHSCGSASAAPLAGCRGREGEGLGVNFLRSMALFLGVPVRGAVSCQYTDPTGNFEGVWITVQPNGSVTTGG